MKAYFYKTTNKLNGKYYYGSGCKDNYIGSGIKLMEAIKKYGIENFEFKILKYFDNRIDAYEFENRFLHLFKLKEDPMSYNMTNMGNGGNRIDYDSPDSQKYRDISKKTITAWNKSAASRIINAERMSKNNPMLIDEYRQKAVKALNDYRSENGSYWTGKNRSDECKQKISETRKQKQIKPYNKGIKLPKDIECTCGKMFSKQGYKKHIKTCNGNKS